MPGTADTHGVTKVDATASHSVCQKRKKKHSLEEKEVNIFPTHHLPYLTRTPLSNLSAADALNDFFSLPLLFLPRPPSLKRLEFLQLCQSGAVQ